MDLPYCKFFAVYWTKYDFDKIRRTTNVSADWLECSRLELYTNLDSVTHNTLPTKNIKFVKFWPPRRPLPHWYLMRKIKVPMSGYLKVIYVSTIVCIHKKNSCDHKLKTIENIWNLHM